MLCYAMLCYSILFYAILCYAMLCYAMLCYTMLCYVKLCYGMLCYVMLCCAMLCYTLLCYAMLCYGMLCCVINYYVMLCYINNSLHLARKYAQIFVRGHYLFREANSFPRAKLDEKCELQGADNVQGQISVHIFKAKWRLLCLLSFKYFSQHAGISRESAGSAILSYVNHVKVCQLASKISTSDFASGRKHLFEEKVKHLKGK